MNTTILPKHVHLLEGEEVVEIVHPHPFSFYRTYAVWVLIALIGIGFVVFRDLILSFLPSVTYPLMLVNPLLVAFGFEHVDATQLTPAVLSDISLIVLWWYILIPLGGLVSLAKINIRCITVASSGNYGVMKLLVNDPDVACRALQGAGFAATLTDVLAVEMPDKPGALHSVAQCLAAQNINLANTSGFVDNNRAILVIEVHDPAQAGEALKKDGFHVLTQKEALTV